MKRRTLVCAIATAVPCAASAVYLNPDGAGQALIYPYYTVQSASGNPFNTYISVVNHTADAKSLRVRFREGRNAAEVASFNLFLPPNDVWTGAVVPAASGAGRLITRDTSCVEAPFAIDLVTGAVPTLEFRNTLYTGANSDAAGDGLDRTREGYVEIIEMATLTGATAAGVGHNAAGFPINCAVVSAIPASNLAAPSGGLTGTLTLINVASGEDFTVNADALADLSARPFHRPASDPYPALDAAEVTAVSVVSDAGHVYRSLWTRGIDAVSAVFMRATWQAEYVLDPGTQSLTDIVLTSPTRRYYVNASGATAPYSRPAGWAARCNGSSVSGVLGEQLFARVFNREEATTTYTGLSDFSGFPNRLFSICTATTSLSVANGSPHMVISDASMVLGSANWTGNVEALSVFANGWTEIAQLQPGALTSLSSSTRIDAATGAITPGSHRFSGLPVTGLFARVFRNGTISCSGGACQGNYGGAFPLRYRRAIEVN